MSLRGKAPEERNPFEAEAPPAIPSRTGNGLVFMSVLVALVWSGASSATFVAPNTLAALFGMDVETFMRMVSGAATIALPAIALVTAGLVARAGIRAREDAAQLATAANAFLNPSPHAEAEARRLGVAVRGEIAALDRSLDGTLQRIAQLEQMLSGQGHGIDAAVASAVAATQDLGDRLEAERHQLTLLSQRLDEQARTLAGLATQQIQQMTETARRAELESRGVSEQLDQRLQSFGASAALLGQRAQELEAAARRSAETTLTLDESIGRALDALANATRLADASRTSADESAAIASRAAEDLRRVTSDSLLEARRTAEQLRNEAQAAGHEAHEGILRLQQAADAARHAAQAFSSASHTSAEEAERRISTMGENLFHASQKAEHTIDRRLEQLRLYIERATGVASTAADRLSARTDALAGRIEPMPSFVPPPQGQAPAAPAPQPAMAPPAASQPSMPRATEREFDAALRQAAPAAPSRPAGAPAPAPVQAAAAAPGGGDAASQRRQFGWSWSDVLSSAESGREGAAQEFRQAPPPVAPAPEPARPSPVSMESLTQLPASRAPAPLQPPGARSVPRDPEGILAAAGVRLEEVFALDTLDHIQKMARGGAGSRRRTVRRMAAEAVRGLEAQFARDPDLRASARKWQLGEGEDIATVLDKGRARMMAPEVRAFLLIDAALD